MKAKTNTNSRRFFVFSNQLPVCFDLLFNISLEGVGVDKEETNPRPRSPTPISPAPVLLITLLVPFTESKGYAAFKPCLENALSLSVQANQIRAFQKGR